MQPPVIVKPIPPQVINEHASYGPFNLKDFIQSPDQSPLIFQAELSNGDPLPKGLICTSDGILTGISGKDTVGNYQVVINAHNDAGAVKAEFPLTIKPSLVSMSSSQFADQLKNQIWQALEEGLPIPDLSDLLERPITLIDIHYLIERWGTLTIWNAYNLDPAGEKTLLHLEGASKHYNVYDRGSCLVAAPKDLYSYERTLEDALMTARAMTREVYKRNWTIQMAGFYKLMRAAWVEAQQLIDEHGKHIEIINFIPQPSDVMLYRKRATGPGLKMGKE